MQMQEYVIVNKLGLHARASALLVKTASRFNSDIRIERENIEVNGKSIR
jgi:phosphocarrier protein HPr